MEGLRGALLRARARKSWSRAGEGLSSQELQQARPETRGRDQGDEDEGGLLLVTSHKKGGGGGVTCDPFVVCTKGPHTSRTCISNRHSVQLLQLAHMTFDGEVDGEASSGNAPPLLLPCMVAAC